MGVEFFNLFWNMYVLCFIFEEVFDFINDGWDCKCFKGFVDFGIILFNGIEKFDYFDLVEIFVKVFFF